MKGRITLRRWIRLGNALLILAVAIAFFSSGWSPPGATGRVLRHNQAADIDASPLFYSEVEHMGELESSVRDRKNSLATVDSAATTEPD